MVDHGVVLEASPAVLYYTLRAAVMSGTLLHVGVESSEHSGSAPSSNSLHRIGLLVIVMLTVTVASSSLVLF